MRSRLRMYRDAYRVWRRMRTPSEALDPAGPPVFIHIPKTGGVSVTSYPVQNAFGHKPWTYYRDAMGGWVPTTFTIVRHPLARAVSAFEYLREERGNALDALWARRRLTGYSDINDFLVHGLPSVVGWMHFKPQATFVQDETGAVKVDHVLRFETLHDDWRAFASEYGLPRSLPHANRAPRPHPTVTAEAQACAEAVYSEDFHLFGY